MESDWICSGVNEFGLMPLLSSICCTCCGYGGPVPTCWPGMACPTGRPLGSIPPWVWLNGPSRRCRLDGDGALSVEPGDDGLWRLPSISDGSRCIWPAFCWSICMAWGLLHTLSARIPQADSGTPSTTVCCSYLFWLLAMAVRGRLLPCFMFIMPPFCMVRIIWNCCC